MRPRAVMSYFLNDAAPIVRRLLRKALVSLLVLFVSLCAYIPIQQQILRRRAELLLADIHALQLRKSTWADAQTLMKRWGAWGKYEGDCVELNCRYEIELSDLFLRQLAAHRNLWHVFEQTRFLYSALGGKLASVRAGFTVLDGVVWEKEYGVDLSVPPKPFAMSNDEYGYDLITIARTVSHFRFPSDGETQLWSPGGCEGCSAMYFEFSPYADPQKVNRLMSFDLSCLTRLVSCRERSEVMPSAWREMMTSAPEEQWKRVEACELPLLVYSREYSNAAIVNILTVPKIVEDGYFRMNVRLKTQLKGEPSLPLNSEREIEFSLRDLGSPTSNRAKDFKPGMEMIVLSGADMQPERCGIIPATEKNLAEVKIGIDRDYASKPRPKQLPLPQ